MSERREKARALRGFGDALVGLGRRMRTLARADHDSDEVAHAIRRVSDDLRAALDEFNTTLGVDN